MFVGVHLDLVFIIVLTDVIHLFSWPWGMTRGGPHSDDGLSSLSSVGLHLQHLPRYQPQLQIILTYPETLFPSYLLKKIEG
jgi:hypothetical protein